MQASRRIRVVAGPPVEARVSAVETSCSSSILPFPGFLRAWSAVFLALPRAPEALYADMWPTSGKRFDPHRVDLLVSPPWLLNYCFGTRPRFVLPPPGGPIKEPRSTLMVLPTGVSSGWVGLAKPCATVIDSHGRESRALSSGDAAKGIQLVYAAAPWIILHTSERAPIGPDYVRFVNWSLPSSR